MHFSQVKCFSLYFGVYSYYTYRGGRFTDSAHFAASAGRTGVHSHSPAPKPSLIPYTTKSIVPFFGHSPSLRIKTPLPNLLQIIYKFHIIPCKFPINSYKTRKYNYKLRSCSRKIHNNSLNTEQYSELSVAYLFGIKSQL